MSTFLLCASLVATGQVAGSQGAKPLNASTVDLRCGAYCLFVALGAIDRKPSSFAELEKRLGQPTSLGYSFQQLGDAARAFEAHELGVETSLDNLTRRPGRFACIALLEEAGHFVCIFDVDDRNVYIADPPVQRVVDRSAFARLWKGKALLISDRPIDPRLPRRFPTLAIAASVLVVAIGIAIAVVIRRHRQG